MGEEKKVSFKKILKNQKGDKKNKDKEEKKVEETGKQEKKIAKKKEEKKPVKKVRKKKDKGEEKVREKKKRKKRIKTETFEKKKEEVEEPEKEEWMILRVGDEYYGVPLGEVEEIRKKVKLTTTPQLPEFAKGMAEVRDLMIPVIDFAKILGISKEDSKSNPVIIIKISEKLIGLEASEIVEIIEISPGDILMLPEIFPSGLFRGGYSFNSKVVGLMKVEGLLKGEKFQSFEEGQYEEGF